MSIDQVDEPVEDPEDLGSDPVSPDLIVHCGGEGMDTEVEFSYVWIANSPLGELSKIDTETVAEVARYKTHDGPYYETGMSADNAEGGMPSRTSVNLDGDVAVANRRGGLAKFHAREEDCAAGNSNGFVGLQTSHGPHDVLPWGQDDCLAWSFDYEYSGEQAELEVYSQRPVAWTSGRPDPARACRWTDQKVWTAVSARDVASSLHVLRLDGEDGSIDYDLWIPEIHPFLLGAYGGAVDSANNFWVTPYHQEWGLADGVRGRLLRVDYEDLSYEFFDNPASGLYSMAIDSHDRIWMASEIGSGTWRFDPYTDEWAVASDAVGFGIAVDADITQRAWISTSAQYGAYGLLPIDTESMEPLHQQFVEIEGEVSQYQYTPRGVAFDFEGRVWYVDTWDSIYRYAPDTQDIQRYSGLNYPYTYSDFSGYGLRAVVASAEE